jgi:glutamate 5-kinase
VDHFAYSYIQEIKFGDNDTLSAITSSMIRADYLFLLTDVDGLYTSNPRKDPLAKAIPVVSSIKEIRSQGALRAISFSPNTQRYIVNTTTIGSNLGTGGMETKLIAAEIATGSGVTTIITSSKNPENISKIIEYHNLTKGVHASSENVLTIVRPPHTLFTPSSTPLPDLESWTSHTLYPAGNVIIKPSAHRALCSPDSDFRLFPADILGIKVFFAPGQAVKIVIRHRSNGTPSEDSESHRLHGSGTCPITT